MKILAMNIDWNIDWANDQILEVLVDSLPHPDQLRYEEKHSLYFAELDGFVNFFYQNGDHRGYGGREFPIILKDGSSTVLKGPWSSRAGCTNNAGFTPCIEVKATQSMSDYRNRFFTVCHMTVAKINEALPKFLPRIHLRRTIKFSEEIYYIPCPEGVSMDDAKKVGIGMFPPRKFNVVPDDAVHIKNPIQSLVDNIAKQAFGVTKAEVHEDMICINCKLPVIDRIHSDLGWKEYGISGLCERCFDSITQE